MEERSAGQSRQETPTSPHQLGDYIRGTGSGLWLLLSGMVILLTGVCVWGIFGRLETRLTTAGSCENGVLTCLIREEDREAVREGMELTVNGERFYLAELEAVPIQAGGSMDPWLLHLGGFSEGEWLYEARAESTLPDGIYEVSVVVESIAPITFLEN